MGVKSIFKSIQYFCLICLGVQSIEFFFEDQEGGGGFGRGGAGRNLLQDCQAYTSGISDDCVIDADDVARIIGGKEEDDPLRWQYVLSLQIELPGECYWHFCGGSLIAPDLIITAAHCIWNRGKDWRAAVEPMGNSIMGNFTISIKAAQNPRCRHQRGSIDGRIPISKYFIPRNYDGDSVDNDIMILQLSKPTTTSSELEPIQINNDSSILNDLKKSLTIVGWGHTTASEAASPLGLALQSRQRKANLEYIEPRSCVNMLKGFAMDTFFNEETMICAYNESADACGGDSGGPLVLEGEYHKTGNFRDDVLVGLVSWGPVEGCTSDKQQVTGVYTNLAHFLPWINEVKAYAETVRVQNNWRKQISVNSNKFGQALGGVGSIEKIVYDSLENQDEKTQEVLPQVMSGDPKLSVLLPCPETVCPEQLHFCCNYEGEFEIDDKCFETTSYNPAEYNYTGECAYKSEKKSPQNFNFVRTFALASQRTPTSVEECTCLVTDKKRTKSNSG